MFTCYAIDDEPSGLETLEDYINLKPNLILLKSFSEPLIALDFIKINPIVDIVFIDIEMPKMDGIELARLIQHKARKIVFATAYKKYGYDAIELNASGYLLKPYPFKKFDNLIENLFPTLVNNDKNLHSFFVKQAGNKSKKVKITLGEVLYFESQLRYTKIKTLKENILSHYAFSEVKDMLLNKNGFIQLHRSFIINTEYIKVIESKSVILTDATKIPIGRHFKSHFLMGLQKN